MTLAAGALALGKPPSAKSPLAIAYEPFHTLQIGARVIPNPIVKVTNRGSSGFVALELVATDSAGRIVSRQWMDRLISPPHHPLPPGETMAIQLSFRAGASLASLDPKIVAALFEGGGAWGDPTEVAQLQSRRRCMRREALTVQFELQRDLAAGDPRAAMLAGLARDERSASVSGNAQCREGAGYPVRIAEAGLRNDRIDGAVPAPRRIMPFVLGALGRVEDWARPLR